MKAEQTKICNRYICEVDFETLELQSADDLVILSETIDVSLESCDSIHASYFNWCNTNSLNIDQGAVRTPNFIARFIIQNIVSESPTSLSELSWLDPCTGSGVFIEELLKHYIAQSKIIDLNSLPNIVAFDISSVGVLHCLLVVKKSLEGLNILFSDYIRSGRITLQTSDPLSIYKERKDRFKINHREFDAVIGNPPYIRSTRLSTTTKKSLKHNFPSIYSGNADLYFYFILSGIHSLKDGGLLSFITPANFLRSSSAKNLRRSLKKISSIKRIVDLDELPVFENVNLHTQIFLLKKTRDEELPVEFLNVRSSSALNMIDQEKHSYTAIENRHFKETGWITSDTPIRITMDEKVKSITLKECGFEILSGIRPSYKDAFVYDEHEVSKYSDDARRWFVECIEGKNIDKWQSMVANKRHLLLLKRNLNTLPPEVSDILEPYKEELKKRLTKPDKGNWFTLRQCAYYSMFESPKIVFPDITARSRFSYDKTGLFIMDGAFFIPTENLSLLAVLNSTIAWEYFVSHCSSLGNASNKGRVRLKKSHVESFPVPKGFSWEGDQAKELHLLVKEIIEDGESKTLLLKIDRIVEEIYK
jgi:hypothetical protein